MTVLDQNIETAFDAHPQAARLKEAYRKLRRRFAEKEAEKRVLAWAESIRYVELARDLPHLFPKMSLEKWDDLEDFLFVRISYMDEKDFIAPPLNLLV